MHQLDVQIVVQFQYSTVHAVNPQNIIIVTDAVGFGYLRICNVVDVSQGIALQQ